MPNPPCHFCSKTKGLHVCGGCRKSVCKLCSEWVDEGSFSFLEKVPETLGHRVYCAPCFVQTVSPALETYRQTLARAREVVVFLDTKGEETRFFRRSEKTIRVLNGTDREETLLRLAFRAAEANFNAIIDVSLRSKQIRNAGYQKSSWEGTAVPTQVGNRFLDRQL